MYLNSEPYRILSKSVKNNHYDLQPNVCPGEKGQSILQWTAYTLGKPVRDTTAKIHLQGVAVVEQNIQTVRITVIDTSLANLYSDNQEFVKHVDAGKNAIWTYSYFLPTMIPDGSYIINMTFVDTNEKELGCAQIT